MKTLLPRIDRNVEMRPRADQKFEKCYLERTKTSFSLIGAPPPPGGVLLEVKLRRFSKPELC